PPVSPSLEASAASSFPPPWPASWFTSPSTPSAMSAKPSAPPNGHEPCESVSQPDASERQMPVGRPARCGLPSLHNCQSVSIGQSELLVRILLDDPSRAFQPGGVKSFNGQFRQCL